MDQQQPSSSASSVGGSPQSSMPAPEPGKKNVGKLFLLGVGTILLVGIISAGVWYQYSVNRLSEGTHVLSIAKKLRTAVVTVNGTVVPYTEYVSDKKTLKHFYEVNSQGISPFTDEQVSDQVISRLVGNVLISEAASELGVSVTDEDMKNAREQLITQASLSEDEVNQEISRLYGWDIATYMERVVRPVLLEDKVKKAFADATSTDVDEYKKEEVSARHILFQVTSTTDDAVALKQATDVLKRIQKGEDFATLAKKYGTDSTKDRGGDLGWFSRGMMVPEFEQAVFALEKGQTVSEPVKTQFGYHLIKLDDRRTAKDFSTYMQKRFKASTITFRLPIHNPFENQEIAAQ